MATCKYCGLSAGFFSHAHKECEEKHTKGVQGMKEMLRRYFAGSIAAKDMSAKIQKNREPYFLCADDIADTAAAVIVEYTETIRRPYTQQTLNVIQEFLNHIGVPYAAINKEAALDRLGQKLFQGFVVEFFAHGVPMSQVAVNTNSVTSVLPLNSQLRDEAYMNVLNKAATNFMKDGTLSDSEEQQLTTYANSIGLSLNCLPTQYANETLERIGQAIVLKELSQGKLPQKSQTVPVMLTKGEAVLWEYNHVAMYQEKIEIEHQGRTGGFSFRICKGVTYRTGQFKGRPVEHRSMNWVGEGSLVVTNKNLIFHCDTASVKIPFSKLVGVTPYSDGLEVHKDEAKPKRMVFQGFDSWFILNVLNQVTV